MLKIITSSKFKVLFIFLTVTFASIFLLLYLNIQSERSLPSQEWSRNIPLPVTTSNSLPFIYNDMEEYHIYSVNEEGISQLIIDDQFNLIKRSTINVDVPAFKPFWAKDNQFIFIKDNNLILYNGDKEQVLFNQADGLSAQANMILFWQENKLFSVDQQSFEINLIEELDSNIESVVFDPDLSASFIVITNPDPSHFHLTLYQKNNINTYQALSLFTITEYPGETISDFQFAKNESDINIIYTTYSIKQGIITYRAYYTNLLLTNIEESPSFEQIRIYEENSAIAFKNPRYLQLTLKNNQLTLLFSANGFISDKENGINIYQAKYTNNKWVANKLSKTRSMSVRPLRLNDETILWLDFEAKDKYSLKGTSTDSNIIKESQNISSNDIYYSLSNTLLSMSVSLLVLFNVFIWVFPPTIFILILFFINLRIVEENTPWVKYTTLALYLITQLLYMQNIFNDNFSVIAPSYFKFPGNFIIIPLLIGGLTYLFVNYSKNNEWDIMKEILYFIGLNAWMITIFLGPYIL